MSPQRGTAGAAGDQRERGSSVARHTDWSIRDWAHWATERTKAQAQGKRTGAKWRVEGTAGTSTENARREAGAGTKRRTQTRGAWQGVRGRGKKVQYEASGRLETSTVRGGVDEGEKQRCTKSTTHVGRANSGSGGRG